LAGFARLKQELEATLGVASIDLATPAILRTPIVAKRLWGICSNSMLPEERDAAHARKWSEASVRSGYRLVS